MAAELLNEANERGDQDWEAVTWAVNYLLHRADQEPHLTTTITDTQDLPSSVIHRGLLDLKRRRGADLGLS